MLAPPGFVSGVKLESLATKRENPLNLLQVVIDQKLLHKEDACRIWGD